MQRLPGLTAYGAITLRWGTTDDVELFEWRQRSSTGGSSAERLDRAAGGGRRREAAVELRRGVAEPLDGTDVQRDGNEVAIEALEITHEGLLAAVTSVETEFPFTLPRGYVDADGYRAS